MALILIDSCSYSYLISKQAAILHLLAAPTQPIADYSGRVKGLFRSRVENYLGNYLGIQVYCYVLHTIYYVLLLIVITCITLVVVLAMFHQDV